MSTVWYTLPQDIQVQICFFYTLESVVLLPNHQKVQENQHTASKEQQILQPMLAEKRENQHKKKENICLKCYHYELP